MLKRARRLRTRLVSAVCLIVTVAFCLCAFISWVYFERNKRSDAQHYLDIAVAQVKSNLDGLFADFAELTTMPYYLGYLDILQKYFDDETNYIRYADQQRINSLNYIVSDLKPDIYSVHILLNNGMLFTMNYQQQVNEWSIIDVPWIARCDPGGAMTLIPYHSAGYYSELNRNVVSFARVLKRAPDYKNVGVFVIDMDLDAFHMGVPQESLYGEQIFLYNDSGDLLYPYPDQASADASPAWRQLVGEGNGFLTATARTESQDISVYGILRPEEYSNGVFGLLYVLLITYCITLVGAVLLIFLLTELITRPIKKLQTATTQLTQHDFSVRVNIDTQDELSELAAAFNWMTEEIQQLLNNINEAHAKEKQIVLSLLLGQIRPHFMYNALESMNNMALADGNFELADGIAALGRLLRHTIDKSESVVYLRDEIDFVEDYIRIRTLNVGDRVAFHPEVDIAHEYLLVPKFTLQPLVENIYEHAPNRAQVHATLQSTVAEDRLILTLTDDGKGIGEKRLLYLKERIFGQAEAEPAADGHQRRGYALYNIHSRIRILYGEPYGLHFPEQPAQGTVLQIILPVIWETEAL